MESSIKDALANAELNHVENCQFIQLDMKALQSIESACASFGAPDVVITDPPRAGMHPKAIEILREWKPAVIVYVSCNPASFARDSNLLCAEQTYRLIKCTPVDLFPQTNHVESIARFERL